MESYVSSLKPRSKEITVDLACRTCEDKYCKKTGNWKSDLTINEIQSALKGITGDKTSILVRKDGPEGEMTAKVPLEDYKLREFHRYVSTVQAKQRMESCIACGTLCQRIVENEIPVDGSFKIV